MESKSTHKCQSCTRQGDPNFLGNNLRPVWCLVDDKGDCTRDEHGNKMLQHHTPKELKCLSMGEKLLIHRCTNMVPSPVLWMSG